MVLILECYFEHFFLPKIIFVKKKQNLFTKEKTFTCPTSDVVSTRREFVSDSIS
jgi:hypothetical protein